MHVIMIIIYFLKLLSFHCHKKVTFAAYKRSSLYNFSANRKERFKTELFHDKTSCFQWQLSVTIRKVEASLTNQRKLTTLVVNNNFYRKFLNGSLKVLRQTTAVNKIG